MGEPLRFPLDWPSEQPRTPPIRRDRGPYRVSQDRAQRELMHELHLLGVSHVVISTNLRVRQDGLPYSTQRTPDDPGVAVYWTRKGRNYCIACDAYRDIAANIRAAGLAIHHLRRLEQAAPSFAERAFSGFARLPASTVAHWRGVLSIVGPTTIEKIEARFRELAKTRHPDFGGTDAAMAELLRARREARAELLGGSLGDGARP